MSGIAQSGTRVSLGAHDWAMPIFVNATNFTQLTEAGWAFHKICKINSDGTITNLPTTLPVDVSDCDYVMLGLYCGGGWGQLYFTFV